jgi:LysR family hydrogen peroxide-inducible transcriptional activator
MNLRDLQYVVRVADLGHFGQAAAACHVSQPTLSGQILKLEQQLGITIFERAGRQVRLTPAGEKIVAEARRVAASARNIAEIAMTNRDPMTGPLRIGIIPTLAPYLIADLLPKANAALPDAPLSFVEDVTESLVAALASGDLDALVIATETGGDRIETRALFEEPLFVLMPRRHPCARRATLRPDELDPADLLLLNEGHCLRDQAIDLCGHPNLGRRAMGDTRATSLETLLHLTAAGYGMTIVPALAVTFWSGLTDKVVARPLVGATRGVRLAFRREMHRREALDALATALRTLAPGSAARRPRRTG